MSGVQVDDLEDKIGDGVGVGAAVPLWSHGIGVDGNVLGVVERGDAVYVGVGSAVESADVDKSWRSVGSMGWEKLVEERCSTVEQDGLRPEEEVGIRGFGVLVAVELVLGYDGLVVRIAGCGVGLDASVVSECGQLGEVGLVE